MMNLKDVLRGEMVIEVENLHQADHITSIMNEMHGTNYNGSQWYAPGFGIKYIGVKQKLVFDFDQICKAELNVIPYNEIDFSTDSDKKIIERLEQEDFDKRDIGF